MTWNSPIRTAKCWNQMPIRSRRSLHAGEGRDCLSNCGEDKHRYSICEADSAGVDGDWGEPIVLQKFTSWDKAPAQFVRHSTVWFSLLWRVTTLRIIHRRPVSIWWRHPVVVVRKVVKTPQNAISHLGTKHLDIVKRPESGCFVCNSTWKHQWTRSRLMNQCRLGAESRGMTKKHCF